MLPGESPREGAVVSAGVGVSGAVDGVLSVVDSELSEGVRDDDASRASGVEAV